MSCVMRCDMCGVCVHLVCRIRLYVRVLTALTNAPARQVVACTDDAERSPRGTPSSSTGHITDARCRDGGDSRQMTQRPISPLPPSMLSMATAPRLRYRHRTPRACAHATQPNRSLRPPHPPPTTHQPVNARPSSLSAHASSRQPGLYLYTPARLPPKVD